MNDKIEFIKLCGVLQSNVLFISQSESRTQLCHVRMGLYSIFSYIVCVNHSHCPRQFWFLANHSYMCDWVFIGVTVFIVNLGNTFCSMTLE